MMPAIAQQSGVSNPVAENGTLCKPVLWSMKDGRRVQIRPISPDDEERMIRFHKGLSERSVYMRYFASLSLATRTTHMRLAQICFADPTRETVLVALHPEEQSGEQEIVAVCRLTKLSASSDAEVALLVLDKFQGLGLGSELLRQLIQQACSQEIKHIEAEMLRDNTAVQRVFRKLGFHLHLADPRSVRAVLNC